MAMLCEKRQIAVPETTKTPAAEAAGAWKRRARGGEAARPSPGAEQLPENCPQVGGCCVCLPWDRAAA